MEIKFSNEKPIIYEILKEKFGVNWNSGLIVTYGDTIHSKNPISEDLWVHESTHVKQQTKMGIVKWWDKYLEDPKFRLKEEKEAYTNQWNWIKSNIKDRNQKSRLRNHIISSMANMYGDMITIEEATKLFKL